MKEAHLSASEPRSAHEPLGRCVATIGFFDGVHLGHAFLLRQVVEAARATGNESVVVTFDRHPREVLRSTSPSAQPVADRLLLTPLDEKLRLLRATGVDRVEVLSFNADLASLSAHDFMASVLRDKLHVGTLIIGYDNRFGHNRAEGFADYVRHGRSLGIDVVQSAEWQPTGELSGMHVSSSTIRHLLRAGDVRKANLCLGRCYEVRGNVAHGYAEGRRLGFPTANLQPESVGQLLPAAGVYAVRVGIGEEPARRAAMLNIGTRPTYGGHELTLEAHIFDFAADIYGARLTLDFVARMRDERHFASPDALRHQLEEDEQEVRKVLNEAHYA